MTRVAKWLGRLLCLAAIGAVVGALSVMPAYTHLAPGMAEIRLSFAHAAPRVRCRERSADELAKLPPQMRGAMDCPRTRSPVLVIFRLDGTTIFEGLLPPTGLSGDGPSRVHRVFPVLVGAHRLSLSLRDSERASGFDHSFDRTVTVAAGQNLVIDFRAESGGFYLR